MTLLKETSNGFMPSEIELIAENQMITIIPKHRMEALDLISGTYGPFRPPIKNDVPLWLALTLKKHGKCNIEPPDWMDTDQLAQKIDEEKASKTASDDIPSLGEVRSRLKTLYDIRQEKAMAGLKYINADLMQQGSQLSLDNLGLMEINAIRPFFTRAFNEVRKISAVDADK
ncbi:DNA replication protein psf2 [Chytridiales sp. JEL 0842]|nr:DNA replication protein psf2 [Chytridiales sp. JEL 0842]